MRVEGGGVDRGEVGGRQGGRVGGWWLGEGRGVADQVKPLVIE